MFSNGFAKQPVCICFWVFLAPLKLSVGTMVWVKVPCTKVSPKLAGPWKVSLKIFSPTVWMVKKCELQRLGVCLLEQAIVASGHLAFMDLQGSKMTDKSVH